MHVQPGYQACTLVVVSGPLGAAATRLPRLVARGYPVAVHGIRGLRTCSSTPRSTVCASPTTDLCNPR